jgi:hypothetical protein
VWLSAYCAAIHPDGNDCLFVADDVLTAFRERFPEVKQEADNGGWIPHKAGDPMPCDGHDIVHLRLRNDSDDGNFTITHWRPAQ